MIKNLIKLANCLDSKGLVREADALDKIIKSAGRMDYTVDEIVWYVQEYLAKEVIKDIVKDPEYGGADLYNHVKNMLETNMDLENKIREKIHKWAIDFASKEFKEEIVNPWIEELSYQILYGMLDDDGEWINPNIPKDDKKITDAYIDVEVDWNLSDIPV